MKKEKKYDTITAVFCLCIEYKETDECMRISLRYIMKGNDEATSFPD
jgi:hypothetical protein